jgi:AcrR family transcriptional regulator
MKVAIAYFYFDYRDRDQQSPEIVVATLLRQLLSYDPSLPKLITDLYRKYQNQQKRAPLEELEGVFRDLCKAFQSVYVVIDALDECDEKRYRRRFLQFLTSMRSYASSSIRFLVTSRPHIADISTTFSSEIPIMLEANDSDVRKYLEKRIEVDGDPEIIDKTFRKTIVEVVAKGAQGM